MRHTQRQRGLSCSARTCVSLIRVLSVTMGERPAAITSLLVAPTFFASLGAGGTAGAVVRRIAGSECLAARGALATSAHAPSGSPSASRFTSARDDQLHATSWTPSRPLALSSSAEASLSLSLSP